MSLKKRWLDFIGRTLNPLTLKAAKRGCGPFSFVRHVGRKSGKTFETPLILAETPGGFVAELTYGEQVNWLRNIMKGGGEIGHGGQLFRIVSVEPYPTDAGLRAFGAKAVILRLLRRKHFRLIKVVLAGPEM
jgi:hypothetical protein